MMLIEAILMEKSQLELENERLSSQLMWLCGIAHGLAHRHDTPPAIKETLQKALKVVGAEKWLVISPPTL
jgi:hypothetical protein